MRYKVELIERHRGVWEEIAKRVSANDGLPLHWTKLPGDVGVCIPLGNRRCILVVEGSSHLVSEAEAYFAVHGVAPVKPKKKAPVAE